MNNAISRSRSKNSILKFAAVTVALVFAAGVTSGYASGMSVVNDLPAKWDAEADVVTVGGGVAGLSLSVSAAQKGLKVVLLEKAPAVGGDAIVSGQFMIGVWLAGSARMGYTDSVEQYIKDISNSHPNAMKGRMGLPAGPTDVIRFYAENIGPTFEWMESLGQKWELGRFQYGMFPNPQWQTNYRGWLATRGIIPPLYEAALKLSVQIHTHTSAQALIRNGQGRVVGVYAMTDDGRKLAIKGTRGVALTTGSFAQSRSLMARFVPTASRSMPIGCPYSDGSGHLMAELAGAKLVDMGLGCHWFLYDAKTHVNNWSILMLVPTDKNKVVPPGPELLHNRPIMGILVNYDGKRFTNENSGYAILGRHIGVQKYSRAVYIWDGHDAPYNVIPTRVYRADDIAALADRLLVDPAVLRATIDRYNGFVDSGADGDFGKVMKNTHRIDKPPYSAVELESRPYATYGGIAINSRCQVLDSNDTPIPGLWAAGSSTGVPFEQAGYFYEGGVGQGAVYGRHAGLELAKEAPWKD